MRKGFVSKSAVSLFCTTLFAVALVLTGCSTDTLTGPQTGADEVTLYNGGDGHNNNRVATSNDNNANTGAFFGKLVERYGGVGGDGHNNNAPGVGGDGHNKNAPGVGGDGHNNNAPGVGGDGHNNN
ncbi:hypothetical protein [Rhodocaloribacter sp.]